MITKLGNVARAESALREVLQPCFLIKERTWIRTLWDNIVRLYECCKSIGERHILDLMCTELLLAYGASFSVHITAPCLRLRS